MPETTISNLFSHIPENIKEEVFDILLSSKYYRLERIVSKGQATAEGEWFDPDNGEWVVLLRGKAGLLFEGEAQARLLCPGDYVNIPARKKHRVEWTSPGEETVWLALHYGLSVDSERLTTGRESLIRKIEVARSRRRSRNVSAMVKNGIMHVSAPYHIAEERLNKAIEELKARFDKAEFKKKLNKEEDLLKAAGELNRRYFAGRLAIKSVRYVTNQNSKFGSCSHHSGVVRIAHPVAFMPKWVRDYVLVHELAHLIEPNHGKDFWDMVRRYELAERARGYLAAKGME